MTAAADALTVATAYTARGWRTVPVPYREKGPRIRGWQKLRLDSGDDLAKHFNGKPSNVGVLLGEPSGGLVDVDLDASEARELAGDFLPPTAAVFGRPGNPASHWLYAPSPLLATAQFTDPTVKDRDDKRHMVVELRSTGLQTVFPGSTHVSGELITWAREGDPAKIAADVLTSSVRRLAAAALLGRHWPGEGGRHAAALCLAGALISHDWPQARAEGFVARVATVAGDDDVPDRVRCVETTVQGQRNGEPLTGLPTLAQHMPGEVVSRVADWLDFGPDHQYLERPDGLYMLTRDGQRRLTNFTIRIVGDVEEDDGADVRHSVEIEAHLSGRKRSLILPAKEFAAMDWPLPKLGPSAVVFAGHAVRDHARTAIQILSGDPPTRRIYMHSGWRQVRDAWLYLHAGGAIGPAGAVTDVTVRLPGRLDALRLPAPPSGAELRDAVRASLRFLDVAPDAVTMPLLAATYRAVLGATDFTIAVIGETGQGKSELQARCQQHYGASFDREHLPTSWESTANAIGALSFAAKDALMVVDDYAPSGTQSDRQRLDREASRVIRTQGNQSGRLRMKSDASLEEAKDPRGLVMMSGEDVPPGHSVRARMFTVELPKGAVRWDVMTRCQADGAAGLYAAAMAGFLAAIARDYERWQADVRDTQAQYRAEVAESGQHRRTPAVVASLLAGLDIFSAFAKSVGALTDQEQDQLLDRARKAFMSTGQAQADQQAEEEPCRLFFDLLRGAIVAKRAHVAGLSEGTAPQSPGAWGWHYRIVAGEPMWEGRGDCVGWLDSADNLYLEPRASYEAARRAGQGLTISATTLKRRLMEGKHLLTVDTTRQRLTVRHMIQGVRRDVLHVAASEITGAEDGG